jgi:hypothetical protein
MDSLVIVMVRVLGMIYDGGTAVGRREVEQGP